MRSSPRAIDQVHEAIPSAQFVMGGRSLSAGTHSRPGSWSPGACPRPVEAVDASVKHAEVN